MSILSQTSLSANTPDIVLLNVSCSLLVNVADWVIMLGGIAVPALADILANSNVLGLVEEKSSNTLCTIRVLGVSSPIFTGLDETKEYLLSSTVSGGMTLVAPSNPGNIVLKLGQPFSSTQFFVHKGIRMMRS